MSAGYGQPFPRALWPLRRSPLRLRPMASASLATVRNTAVQVPPIFFVRGGRVFDSLAADPSGDGPALTARTSEPVSVQLVEASCPQLTAKEPETVQEAFQSRAAASEAWGRRLRDGRARAHRVSPRASSPNPLRGDRMSDVCCKCQAAGRSWARASIDRDGAPRARHPAPRHSARNASFQSSALGGGCCCRGHYS